jgi:putative addiction module component (TIGR02574 family)
MSFRDIEETALRLSEKESARLAYTLLKSLPENGEDEYSEQEIEHLWAEEAQRRADEWNAGRSECMPGDQVFREARERLKSR